MDERNNELLLNPKCRTMTYFQWYKDIFLTKVMQRKDCNNTFWKEKIITRLTHLFLEKVRETLKSISLHMMVYHMVP
ncbi:hypothetical protein REPUB_Repub05bG0077500 [Reevesia pubescens]